MKTYEKCLLKRWCRNLAFEELCGSKARDGLIENGCDGLWSVHLVRLAIQGADGEGKALRDTCHPLVAAKMSGEPKGKEHCKEGTP